MAGRKLSIALEEGFLGDRVLIRVGGHLLAELEDLSTRVQIGLARTVEVELPDGERALSIELPDKGVSATVALDDNPPAYIGVSVADGDALTVRSGEAPPGYA